MRHLLMSLVIVLAAGCTHTVRKSEPGPIPVNSFVKVWEADCEIGTDPIASLYLHDQIVIAYSRSNRVLALARGGGELLHMEQPTRPGNFMRPPIVLPNRIIYATSSTLEIFTRRGEYERSILLPFSIRSNLVGFEDKVFMGTDHPGSGRFAAIDTSKLYAYIIWELYTFGTVVSTPAFHQGAIYFGTTDGRIYAISSVRGNLWPFNNGFLLPKGGRVLGDVKADESGVYYSGTDGTLVCLDRSNGKVKWQYFSGKTLTTGPTVSPTTVYQLVDDIGMVAIDKFSSAYNRTIRWSNPDAVQLLAEDSKFSYMLMRDNHIAALDRMTGEVKFQNSRTDFVSFVTNLQDGMIYAGTRDGRVFAIKSVLRPGTTGELE